MSIGTTASRNRSQQVDIALRIAIVVLTLATAAIHVSLGGLLFLLNAIGFTVLAAAMAFPGDFARRFRWAPRLALLGFSLATIGGWMMFGARYEMGYLATGIEIGIVALLVVDILRAYGSPAGLVREIRTSLGSLLGQTS